VWLRQNVGRDDLGVKFGMLADMSRVLMTAHIEPRPAVEPAILKMRNVVRNQVVTQGISFVGGAPESARHKTNGFPNAVPDAISVNTLEFSYWSELFSIRGALWDEMIAPAESQPVTFAIVRNISGIVSTASSIAIPSSGIPMDESIGVMTMIAPPGIPGTVKLMPTALTALAASLAHDKWTP
jgi:hypothetical protein